MTADLVVVGGGASAALVVDALRRARPARRWRVTVVEGAHPPGRGVPYRTGDVAHRMNVPARRLSVDPGDPDHLVRWLAGQGRPTEPDAYIPRGLYGAYLEAVLAGDLRPSGSLELTVVADTVTTVARRGDGFVVGTSAGADLTAAAVVLAIGAPAGATPLPVDGALAGDPSVVLDPWAPGALGGDGPRWLVVGTGLTMVDVALTILRRPETTVDAVSRHGWLPQAHPVRRVPSLTPIDVGPGPLTAARVRRAVVHHAATEPNGWAASVDRFRDASAELWPRLDETEQAKLLRRRFSTWKVHRHRMPPAVAASMLDAVAAGRCRIHTGTVASIAPVGSAVALEVHRRGRPPLGLVGDRVVDCTGPSPDIAATTDPLVRRLLASGLAVVGPHSLGLAVDACGTVIDATGRPVDGLVAIGALRRGTVFETTAIPELRIQAADIARRLLARR